MEVRCCIPRIICSYQHRLLVRATNSTPGSTIMNHQRRVEHYAPLFSGGSSEGDTPDLIPNSEVKPSSADDSLNR